MLQIIVFYTIPIVFLILFIFHIITRYGRRGRLFSKIPGPKPYPLIGNLLMVNSNCTNEIWDAARKIVKDYSPISKIWGVESALLNVHHPDDLEILLSSQKVIEKGFPYYFLQPWLKTGLLTSTDEKWRQRRKILTPAFHFGILKKYIEITSEEAEKFVEHLKSEGDETIKSLAPLCSNYTLNIICESTLGVTLDNMDPEIVKKYKKAIHDMGKIVIYRVIRPYIYDWVLPFLPRLNREHKNVLGILHGFTSKVINERREYHRSMGNKFLNNMEELSYIDIDVGLKKRLAMLDLLLAAEMKGLIDDQGIREEVDTFTFEGHDTSATAMMYTLMVLAENKEAQNLARAEVTEILDRNGGRVGIQEIQEFHYLERCIKESLRLYPPVSTMVRFTEDEFQLKNGLCPAKVHIMIHVWDTHRDPNFWPEPEKFNPDRFLPEYTKYRHPFAYVPFSAGPRNCIGQKFAMMELKSLIGRLLYDFYLEPIDRLCDMKISADVIMRPMNPVHVKFIRINKNS